MKYPILLVLLGAALLRLPGAAESREDLAELTRMLEGSGKVLESKVLSTVLDAGSSPVSLYGEARLKIRDHYMYDHPAFMTEDRGWTQLGWEEPVFQIGLVVRPNRHTVLWSKMALHYTLPGNYTNAVAGPDTSGWRRVSARDSRKMESASIQEDMSAGMTIMAGPSSFSLRAGGVLWVQASPLTIWKAPPRHFVWDYLPYEWEQPVSQYFRNRIFNEENFGRYAWNKKIVQGLGLESANLPGGLYLNLVYADYDAYDKFEREYVDWFESDASYSHLLHGRLAFNSKEALGPDLTLGLNIAQVYYEDDVALATIFRDRFRIARRAQGGYQPGSAFYKEPHIMSLDLKGSPIGPLEFHGDFALGRLDTTWLAYDSLGIHKTSSPTGYTPAVFLRLKNKRVLPVQADLAYISRGFYSPFSFVTPIDAFFPFGSNLLGAGRFMAGGDASPYTQNMAGINLTVTPQGKNSLLKVSYGQHFQLEASRDVIFFPYRLHSQDLYPNFQTSYNRFGTGVVDNSLTGRYDKRLGDESFRRAFDYKSPLGPEAGGLRSDYLGMYEGFVPYASEAEAEANANDTTGLSQSVPVLDGIRHRSPEVPVHRKYTFNFEMDGTYDLGPAVGYPHNIYLNGYFAMNGISTGFRPLALDEKGLLLWGTLFRFEPSVALTEKFYLLGLAGYENWRSELAYMYTPATASDRVAVKDAVRVPLDYRDWAFGAGFDWDVLARVGLHGRLKWMTHEDVNFPGNNWNNRLMSAEVKMWF